MKMLSACLLLLPFISCTQVQDTKNDAVIEQKIEALLSRMTLEEKIGQMNQISSYGNIEDMSGLIKKGEVGSILNEVDPVRVNALQRVAMEESRLGIPLLMARDVSTVSRPYSLFLWDKRHLSTRRWLRMVHG